MIIYSTSYDRELIALPIPDPMLTAPPTSEFSVPPNNDTDSPALLPDPDFKLNNPPLPPVD